MKTENKKGRETKKTFKTCCCVDAINSKTNHQPVRFFLTGCRDMRGGAVCTTYILVEFTDTM
jgi:hypothetical protein